MFATWTILLIFASILTIISFRNINILLSLGATIGWFSLMAFNLENPLVGVAQGSIIHQWLTMGLIAIGLAVMLMYFRNRGRTAGVYGSRSEGSSGGGEGTSPSYERKPIMEKSTEEYRDTLVRPAVRRRRRRR